MRRARFPRKSFFGASARVVTPCRNPQQHSAGEWADRLQRMHQYIDGADFVSLQPQELTAILQYLQDSASG